MTDEEEATTAEPESVEFMDVPTQGQLTVEDAITNVDQATRLFQGNRDQHIILQQSVALLAERARRPDPAPPNRAARRAKPAPKKQAPRKRRR